MYRSLLLYCSYIYIVLYLYIIIYLQYIVTYNYILLRLYCINAILTTCYMQRHYNRIEFCYSCKWIDFDLSLKIPYNCTYDTSESAPWTLSQLNSNNSWKSFSLVKGSQDLRLDLFCRSKNELRLKVTQLYFLL